MVGDCIQRNQTGDDIVEAELHRKLSRLFNTAKDEQELALLIEGLLTPQEIEGIIFRWRLITRLLRGMPQRQIASELGISLGKIARGSRLLKYGPPEFRKLMKRLEPREEEIEHDQRAG